MTHHEQQTFASREDERSFLLSEVHRAEDESARLRAENEHLRRLIAGEIWWECECGCRNTVFASACFGGCGKDRPRA